VYVVVLDFIRCGQFLPAGQKRKIFPWSLLLLFVSALLSSCASVPEKAYMPPPGVQYLTASWYGPKFHGRPTASGERFDMYAMTCAHKTYKFGTKLRVTNPDNGRSVVVTVNDRGPFVRGRDLDLSYGAAREIGLVEKGVGRVRVEYLGRDERYVRRVPYVKPGARGGFTIQLGSFTDRGNALRFKRGLELKYRDVYITTVVLNGRKYFRVRAGSFDDYSSAYSLAEKLADEGYRILIMSRD
jgi:rare lipoprotein A